MPLDYTIIGFDRGSKDMTVETEMRQRRDGAFEVVNMWRWNVTIEGVAIRGLLPSPGRKE